MIDVDINLSPTGDGRVIAFVKNTDPRGQKGERRDPEAIPAREARRAIPVSEETQAQLKAKSHRFMQSASR